MRCLRVANTGDTNQLTVYSKRLYHLKPLSALQLFTYLCSNNLNVGVDIKSAKYRLREVVTISSANVLNIVISNYPVLHILQQI